MADKKLGGVFVDIVGKGFEQTKKSIESVKKQLQGVETYAANLRKRLNDTPLMIRLRLEQERTSSIESLRKQLQDIPKEKRIKIIAEQIEVAQKQVQALENQLKKNPTNLKIKAELEHAKEVLADLEKLKNSSANLRKQLNDAPLTVKLRVDQERKDSIEALKKQLEDVPKEKRIKIIAEQIEITRKKVQELESQLQKTPKDLKIKAELENAKAMQADLEKLKGNINKSKIDFDAINSSITAVGKVAQTAFLAGTGAVAGFLKAADPVGVMKLQGTFGALSVQIGTIFIPIIDAVQQILEKVLTYFRSLNDAQKSNILRWVAVGAAVLGLIMLVPKLIALINFATGAMAAFGVSTGVATGGISTIIGLIAALGGTFLIMGASADESKGIFSSLFDLIKPFTDGFKSLIPVVEGVFGMLQQEAGKALAVVKPFLEKLAVGAVATGAAVVRMGAAFMPLVRVWMTINRAFMSVLLPITGMFIRIAQTIMQVVAKVVTAVMTAFAPVYETITEIVEEVAKVIEEVVNAVIPLIEELATQFQELVPIIEWVAGIISDVLKAILPYIKSFIMGIIDAIKMLAKTAIWVAALLKSIKAGNVRGALDAANQAVADFDDKMKDKGSGGSWDDEKKERHAPLAAQQVSMVGFAELWKKAQTASIETPESKMAKERTLTQKKMFEEQQKTNKILSEKESAIMLPGGFGP